MKASYQKYDLVFKRPSGTSRGVLRTKETWFLKLEDEGKVGYGECGLFRGLSIDDTPDYELKLKWVVANIHKGKEVLLAALKHYPSIQFGIEQAFLDLASPTPFELLSPEFIQGTKEIPINGLIWMGDKAFMQEQIREKLASGFTTIKMKIGAIDFDTEISLLKAIREEFSADAITLRVDANGAFSPNDAMSKLQRLSELDIHSIEQPIKQGQWQEMAALCENSPVPIALDEELIGIFDYEAKVRCLETIRPQFIILKPSLVGGFQGSTEWIELAAKQGADNWITSALESNIGLNAIAQWTATLNNPLPQGLGTGSLFTNNITSPLVVKSGQLTYNPALRWEFNM